MSIGNKLNKLIEHNNVSVNELSKNIDVSPQTLYGILKRDNKKVDITLLSKICKFFGVSMSYFDELSQRENILSIREIELVNKYRALGEGEKIAVENIINLLPAKVSEGSITYLTKAKTKKIPLSTMSVSAGFGNYLFDDSFEIIEVDLNKYPNADLALRISGDSMEPKYTDNEIIYVEKQNTLEDGQIGVFVLNNTGYLKQFKKIDNKFYLNSLNKKYKPIEIKDSDDFLVVGKVL